MTRKLIARKHVCAAPHRNVVRMETHSDGQHAGYFPRILWTLLLALGYSEPPLFIGILRLLHGNSYLWRVCLIIYEWLTTDHIRRIHWAEFLVLQLTCGMCTWKPMRNPRASTGQNLELLSMHIMSPEALSS
jgi:hypothetical protein